MYSKILITRVYCFPQRIFDERHAETVIHVFPKTPKKKITKMSSSYYILGKAIKYVIKYLCKNRGFSISVYLFVIKVCV